MLAGVSGLAIARPAHRRPAAGVRLIAALGVAAVVWGWGVAQYPVLLPGTAVTLSNAGAPASTMVALVILFIVAVLCIGPSLALLFSLQGRRLLHADETGTLATACRRLSGPAPAGQNPVIRAAVVTLVVLAALVRRRRPSLAPLSGTARFDPMRPDAGPVSFGGGAHFCIGAALAQARGRRRFPRLLNRFPQIAAAGEPTRMDRLLLRGFDTLPVTVA